MGYKVAVLGATGNVGREMLNVLAEREFPASRGASPSPRRRSLGMEVSYGDRELKIARRREFRLGLGRSLPDVGGLAASQGMGAEDRRQGLHRDRQLLRLPDGPGRAAGRARGERRRARRHARRSIIANPNCSTAQMVVALKPLHDVAKIKRVVVSTYQSVSGAGKEAMDELWTQTKGIFVNRPLEPQAVHQADRLQRHPAHRRLHGRRRHQGRVEDGGRDARRSSIPRSRSPPPACACRCSSAIREAVNIEFENPITADEARHILREAPGVHGRRQARGRRLRHAGRMRRRIRDLSSAASART